MNKRTIVSATAAVMVAVGAILVLNWLSVTGPVRDVVSRFGNEKVDAWAYHRWGVLSGEIVFDLRGISEETSAADVMRVLLQFASEVKESRFETVYLAWRGDARFKLEGAYFNTLGREYGVQNAIYTLRTFPENVNTLEGSPAFGRWSGGVIGVMSRQMDDLLQFHRKWFMTDAMAGMR